METEWIDVKERLPMNGIIVDTKIDKGEVVTNEQQLKRSGNLWFFPDGSMYVYYVPTHWKNVSPPSSNIETK